MSKLDVAIAQLKNNSITTLDLSGSYSKKGFIDNKAAGSLAKALQRNTSLKILKLYNNNIGDAGAKELSTALTINSSLSVLGLGDNQIGDNGAKELSTALTANSSLSVLNLGANKIGDDGARELSMALTTNSSLSALYLGNNKIGKAGAKELSIALTINSSLSVLYLGNNKIGKAGAKELSIALKGNKTITCIDLSGSNINTDLLNTIKSYCNRNINDKKTEAEGLFQTADKLLTSNSHDDIAEAAKLLAIAVKLVEGYWGRGNKDNPRKDLLKKYLLKQAYIFDETRDCDNALKALDRILVSDGGNDPLDGGNKEAKTLKSTTLEHKKTWDAPNIKAFNEEIDLLNEVPTIKPDYAYDKATKVNTNFALAHYNKGMALYYSGHKEEAIIYYNKVIELNPDLADAYYYKGVCLAVLGHYEEAIICYDKAIELNSNLAWSARSNKGLVLCHLGRFDYAIVELKITELHLSGSSDFDRGNIGDKEVARLAEVLKYNTLLKTLELGWNQIGGEGARELAKALKINTSLSYLDISSNQIGADGAHELAEALKINTSLSYLDIGQNIIGDEGARELAKALKINTSLSYLDIVNSQIGDVGARELAEALKINTSLSYLNLYYNDIGDVGARELAKALKINTSLSYLNILDTLIGDNGVPELAEALKVNKSVTYIAVGNLAIINKFKDLLKTIDSYCKRNVSDKKTEAERLFKTAVKLLTPDSDFHFDIVEASKLLGRAVKLVEGKWGEGYNDEEENKRKDLLKKYLLKQAHVFDGIRDYESALKAVDRILVKDGFDDALDMGNKEAKTLKTTILEYKKAWDDPNIQVFNEKYGYDLYYTNNKGYALYDLRRYKEAITKFDIAIKIKPDYAGAHWGKGRALYMLGLHQDAIVEYDIAIKIKPDHAYAHHNKGVILCNLGCYEEAIAEFDIAIKIKPDYALAYANKGIVLYNNLGRKTEAVVFYDKAIKIKPYFVNALHNKKIVQRDLEKSGDEEYAQGSYAKAIELYEEALSINKNDRLFLKLGKAVFSQYAQGTGSHQDFTLGGIGEDYDVKSIGDVADMDMKGAEEHL